MEKSRLEDEINYQLSQLEKVATISQQILNAASNEQRLWDAAAAAKYISDFILGLENIIKRKNIYLNRHLPEGPDYHQQLLTDFLNDPDLGKQLAPDIQKRLKKYLRFRHRFIHGYGHEVSWEIVEEPLQLLADTIHIIKTLMKNWIKQL